MSIALLSKVESLEDRLKLLESAMVGSVSLNDVLALVRDNKDLRTRLDALEKKVSKRG